MSGDAGLLLMIGGLHAAALAAATGLMLLAFRGGHEEPGDDRDGSDGGTRRGGPPRPPAGGPPLADAHPAPVRLRAPQRLSDLLPPAPRRPAHGRPRPVPERDPHAVKVGHG